MAGLSPFPGRISRGDWARERRCHGAREWAYDRESRVGRLDRALEEASKGGWTVVDMSRDWKRVFPFEPVEGVRGRE